MTYESQLQKLRIHYRDNGQLPNYDGMREIFKCKSKSTAYYAINKLVSAGFLKRSKSKLMPGPNFMSLPYYKSVRAGFPSPVEAMPDGGYGGIGGRMSLDEYLIDLPNSTFFVKVKGDNMNGAGILNGDIVVVKRSSDAKLGQTVVVSIEGELTVKILIKKGNRFFLESANPQYPTLSLEDNISCGMMGVVTGVVRKL